MGVIKEPSKVKLIFGLISSNEKIFLDVEKVLSNKFGPIDFSSATLAFTFTSYYNQEMGEHLKRKFISLERLIKPDSLSDIKLFTNKLEAKFSNNNKRRINIDPGYISSGKLVLASTKDYSHRIYLKNGIFAETTLFYENNSFNPMKWTYPDYRTKEYIDIFNNLYKIYFKQLSKKR